MTTLANRPNVALVVIDVQNGVLEGAYRRSEVLEAISRTVERARRDGAPVLWIRHLDETLKAADDASRIVAELVPAEDDAVVEKSYRDAFEDTRLEHVLAQLGVGKIVVAGAQSDMCVRSTLHGAVVRGYDAVLVADAHTTVDRSAKGAPSPDAVIRHTNLYWSNQRAPGRSGGIVTSAEVDFSRGAAAAG